MSEDEENALKLLDALMKFQSYFAEYVKSNDPELFRRAVDYAKTFTEQDVEGISMNYINEDKDGKTSSS